MPVSNHLDWEFIGTTDWESCNGIPKNLKSIVEAVKESTYCHAMPASYGGLSGGGRPYPAIVLNDKIAFLDEQGLQKLNHAYESYKTEAWLDHESLSYSGGQTPYGSGWQEMDFGYWIFSGCPAR